MTGSGTVCRSLRVLHVIVPEPPGSVGGSDMHVLDLAAAQQECGLAAPVVLETLSPPFVARLRAAGVEAVSTAGLGPTQAVRRIRRLMVDGRFDLVHSHGYDGTWWALVARAMVCPRPPLVVTCHGWIETTRRLRVMSALDRASNRLAAGMVVVSDELVATALRSAGRARVFAVVPNGVRTGADLFEAGRGAAVDVRARLGLPPGTVLVGAMGRLSPEKRHDVYVDACAVLHSRHPDVHFVLAGGGPLLAALRSQATRLGLARLHLLGLVDHAQHVLHQFDVVVQPSDVETTSRVVLESMAQGRPVVATAVGGTPAILRDGIDGLLVRPGSPAAVAAEVDRLLCDPELRLRLGTAARRRVVAGFSLSAMADGVHDVYRAVLGEATSGTQAWVRNDV